MTARATTTVAFLLATALHLGLFFGLGSNIASRAEYTISGGESVELTLIAAESEPQVQELPVPEILSPPPTEPDPEPVSEPVPVEPEMIEPPSEAPPSVPRKAIAPRPRVSNASAREQRGSATSGARTQARPSYLSNPPPAYPTASRQAGEKGIVLLRVSVTEQGRVASVTMVRSSGFPRLDVAARDAVQRWRFSPGRIGGFAIVSEVEVPVRFQLND